MTALLKTLAIAAALVATVIPAMPAAAATQCYPQAMMAADPSPIDRPKPPAPKCEFPAGAENHQMADFYLFDTKCAHKPNPILARLSAKFEKLPSDIRSTALDHETKLIEAIPDFINPGWPTASNFSRTIGTR